MTCIGRREEDDRKEVNKLSKRFSLTKIGKWTSPLTRLYKSKGLTYKYANKARIKDFVVKWDALLKNWQGNIKDAAYIFECEAINLINYQTKFKKLPFQLKFHFPALRKYLSSL